MFHYELRREGTERVTVQIEGHLVLGEPTRQFRDCLATVTDRYSMIVVDAVGLDYLDSAGLGELVRARSDAAAAGGVLALVGATRRIRDLLVLTKLLAVFDAESAPVS
jgi:anti-anti-sigma factor